MTLNKKLLAGLVAFAAASTSVQAVTVAANDGWTLGVSGLVNQFVTFANDDANANSDNQTVSNGLLPNVLKFSMTAPTINGLDMAAHVSFNPGNNNQDAQEQREVYFTVDGSFGQILAGKTLGLYGSHNIATEQTIYGVGHSPVANGSTSLGGIGFGYDYASWRSQVRWTSNDMNGFKIAVAVLQAAGLDTQTDGPTGLPQGSLNATAASEDLRYEADLSYAGTFDNGSYTAWLSAMTQERDGAADDSDAWTVGATATFGGFEVMAQYSDAEGADGNAAANALEWDQYVVQAGYRFAGTTLVSVNYSEVEEKGVNATAGADKADRLTVGVYHDVNANLKLVAEYSKLDNDANTLDQDLISLGGFFFF